MEDGVPDPLAIQDGERLTGREIAQNFCAADEILRDVVAVSLDTGHPVNRRVQHVGGSEEREPLRVERQFKYRSARHPREKPIRGLDWWYRRKVERSEEFRDRRGAKK